MELHLLREFVFYHDFQKRNVAGVAIAERIFNESARRKGALIGSFGKFDLRGGFGQRCDHGVAILNRIPGKRLRRQRQGQRGKLALQREFKERRNRGCLPGIQRNFRRDSPDFHRIFALPGFFGGQFQRQAIGVRRIAEIDDLELIIERTAEGGGLRLGRDDIHLKIRGWCHARFRRGGLSGLRRCCRRRRFFWFRRRCRRLFRLRRWRWRRRHALAEIIAMVEMGLQGAFVNFDGLRVIGISWRKMADSDFFLFRFRRWLYHRQHERRRALGGFRMNRLIRCQPIYRDSGGKNEATNHQCHLKHVLLCFHIVPPDSPQ
ncbi:hypothetical protein U14_03178 [Candidatus Moduliflexus flocculans]|uniref:Uncharacterized protein n=1 Tax=Candidatus Moduliflexus flocculans TaxID=1499966 RepID=A0A081BNG6_9BACT|nr:hypothetical protein U14_03178 [Candidatus Moduliflexus flocculans]